MAESPRYKLSLLRSAHPQASAIYDPFHHTGTTGELNSSEHSGQLRPRRQVAGG